jgi:hypothetical protein
MLRKNWPWISLIILFAGCKRGEENPAMRPANLIDYKTHVNPSDTITLKQLMGSIRNFSFIESPVVIETPANKEIENISLNGVWLKGLKMADIDFLKGSIRQLRIENSTIEEIDFSNIDTLTSLEIINCKIDRLIFYETCFNGVKIISDTDTLGSVVIRNCKSSKDIFFRGLFKEILFEGGEVTHLDITQVQNDDCRFKAIATKLNEPNLYSFETASSSVFLNAEIANAMFELNKSSWLKEEKEVDKMNRSASYNTRREVINKRYSFVISGYMHLAKLFDEQKRYDVADYFYVRSKACERKAEPRWYKRAFIKVFHEKMRGDYGTNLGKILWTFLLTVCVFTFVYWILAIFKIGFGYYTCLRLDGSEIHDHRPIFISLNRNWSNGIEVLRSCFFLSMNQLLLGSLTKDFVKDILVFASMPPKKYSVIGIGRLMSVLQYLLGIILLCFLISSFLHLSR